MLGRVLVFAAVLSALAVVAPKLAPGLLSVALQPGAPAPSAVAGAEPVPAAPRESDVRHDGYRQVALRADSRGHFLADATINGRSFGIIVDTGATTVALTEATAHRLGIRPPQSAYRLPMATANGTVMAAPVVLNEVRIGSVAVRNVEATVAPGETLGVNLLGMSFLRRLSKFEVAGGQLVLSQ